MAIQLPDEIADGDVKKYVGDVVWPEFVRRRSALDRIAMWVRGNQPDYLVQHANREKRALLKLAKTPWLGLVVTHFTQALFVDGYRSEGDNKNAPGPWTTWNANNMQAKQIGIHRAALTYGYSFGRVLPGVALDGANQAELRGFSPRRVFALYEDQTNDDYPKYALELAADAKSVRFYTDKFYYTLPMPTMGKFPDWPTDDKGNPLEKIKKVEHGVGVCPFVRYVNTMDLDGFCMGEVEYLVPAASKIDKTDYDRLLAQHYNSWKVKVATGIDDLDAESTPEEAQRAKLKLAQDDILMHGNAEAKFYTLPETDLSGFISAHSQDVQNLATNAQLPPWILTGQLANLSADALTAATKGTVQKLYERQVTFGTAHNQLLRLAAHIEGDQAGARDFTASVSWQDTSVRSLAQAVDAYGKAAQMLGMPKEFLWSLIPGITQSDIDSMKTHFNDQDDVTQMLMYWTPNGPGGQFASDIEVGAQKDIATHQGDIASELAAQTAAASKSQAVAVAKATPPAPTVPGVVQPKKRGVPGNDPSSRGK